VIYLVRKNNQNGMNLNIEPVEKPEEIQR